MTTLLLALILAAIVLCCPLLRRATFLALLMIAALAFVVVASARAADDRENVAFVLAVVYVYETRCQKVLTKETDEFLVMLYRHVGEQRVADMLDHVEAAFAKTGRDEWCAIARDDVVAPMLEPIP
jgi:hypothetical protein